MRPTRILFGLAIAASGLVSSVSAGSEGNVNFVLGARHLQLEDVWTPFEDQGVFGVMVDFGGDAWPVHLEIGALGSGHEETFFGRDVTLSIGEISVGVLKDWDRSRMHPYIGAGVAAATVEFDNSFTTEDDTTGGLYFRGGVLWRLGSRVNLGIDARLLTATQVDAFGPGADVDIDYAQIGGLIGWGWPKSK